MPLCTDPIPLDHLEDVVAAIEEAHHRAGPDVGPSLVRLRSAGHDHELALAPAGPRGVLADLLGTSAPDRWWAVGVVVDGTARTLPDGWGPSGPLDPARAGPPEGRVRAAVLCARDGATASVLRRHGADPVRTSSPPGVPGPVGRVVDALRRTLDLPTPPPDTGTGWVAAQVWLHRVHALALDGGRVDVALVESLRPPVPASWTAVREQRAAGAWVELDVTPELATWMDDGMFSRWCGVSFPEPVEVLAALAELVPASVVDHLAARLAGGTGGGPSGGGAGSVRA